MSVLVGFHLGQAEHCVLALPAVVVRLLAVVGAVGDVAHLGGGVLLEARRDDRVQLLVLPFLVRIANTKVTSPAIL